MKTSACFAFGLFLFSLGASAQSPVQEVIDNALIQQTNTNTQSIMSMLQQQLDEAQKQSQSLTDQLTRMGDPSTVSLPALEVIKQDIAKSAQAATNGASREERIRATTGSEAFGDNAYGLVNGVGPTVTFKDGTTADRDPSLYKLQGALSGDLDAVAEKSRDADDRIAQLQEQRSELLDMVSSADLATTIKLQIAINAIDTQIASVPAAVMKSKMDYDVLKEKLQLQAQVEAKAKAEERKLQDKHTSETATSSSGTSSGSSTGSTTTSPFGNLGWGKK
ncbi:MAG: hypothetical protein J0L73_02660 [Verrucomicrobia bacterium]|nr:hypothetical protein [Verrucomicrobiota bacterium]